MALRIATMSFLQVVASSAFEVQFPGDALPFTLVPGKNGYSAIMDAWVSEEDREFFSDMYPRLRPGLIVAQCNGTSTDILEFEVICKLIEDAKQPRHFLFVERKSKWDIVRARLSYIAKNMANQQGGTDEAAKEMSRRGHLALLQYIRKKESKYTIKQLSKITNIDFQDHSGTCALHIAIGRNNVSLVNMLLRRNADVFVQNKNGTNGLMIAVACGYQDLVELLLEYEPAKTGGLVHETDAQGLTALHYGAREGHVSIIRTLLANDAKAHQKTVRQMTPLHYASLGGHADAVRLFLHLGFSNHDLTRMGGTALEFSSGRHDEVTRMLECHGAGAPVHCVFDGRDDAWLGSSGGRVYLGSWESISPWWLKTLQIDCLITALDAEEESLDRETIQYLLDSIEDSDTATTKFVQRTPADMAMRKKRRVKDVREPASDGSVSDDDSSSMVSSSLLSSSVDSSEMSFKTSATDDSASRLVKTVYRFDAHGKSTVVETLDEDKFPPFPKALVEHFKLDVANNVNTKRKWKRLLQFLPSAARLLDERLKNNKRVLIACHGGECTGPAICAAFLMTKRGIEREKGGLPFFRNKEACEMISSKRKCFALTKVCADGLERLQEGLDYRRNQAARKRLMELYKVI